LLKAAAHITGGGLPGNVPRVLPNDVVAAIEPAWSVPPVFRWLARAGRVPAGEMIRVFNCGLGMVLVVSDPDSAEALLTREGEIVHRIGRIEPGRARPGIGLPGTGLPGTGQPGIGQPGIGQPGIGQPGTGEPGTGEATVRFQPPEDWLA
jgi:PPE-repeat protein